MRLFGREIPSVPSTTVFRHIGMIAARDLEQVKTCPEIARAMGMTPQRVEYESQIALGKLVFGLAKRRHLRELVAD